MEALETFLEEQDSRRRFFEIKFLLARAYRECNEIGKANKCIGDIVKLTPNRVMKKKADLELALTMEAAENKERAYSSYQLIALHPNPSGDPELKPIIHIALLRCIDLALEAGAYGEVVEFGDKFIEHYSGDDAVPDVKVKIREAKLKQAQVVPAAAE